MQIVSLIFLFAGAALLFFGYRKNNRAILVAAAFAWLVSGAWGEFSQGFNHGLDQGSKDARSAQAAAVVRVP